jgi:hypothetical protein
VTRRAPLQPNFSQQRAQASQFHFGVGYFRREFLFEFLSKPLGLIPQFLQSTFGCLVLAGQSRSVVFRNFGHAILLKFAMQKAVSP